MLSNKCNVKKNEENVGFFAYDQNLINDADVYRNSKSRSKSYIKRVRESTHKSGGLKLTV